MPFVRLSFSPRLYLAYQAFGSVLVNFIINYGFAWLARHEVSIPVFGLWGSVAWDTVVTAVLLTFLTVVSGSFFIRLDLRRGVTTYGPWTESTTPWLGWFSRSVLRRAVAFTLVFAPLGAGLGLLLLTAYPKTVTFAEFAWFKVTFACLLGFLVTPLNALWVIASLPVPGARSTSVVPRSERPETL